MRMAQGTTMDHGTLLKCAPDQLRYSSERARQLAALEKTRKLPCTTEGLDSWLQEGQYDDLPEKRWFSSEGFRSATEAGHASMQYAAVVACADHHITRTAWLWITRLTRLFKGSEKSVHTYFALLRCEGSFSNQSQYE